MICTRRFATVGFAFLGLATVSILAAVAGMSADTCACIVRLLTCGVLTLSTIAALCGDPSERPVFAGFAFVGWGYFALAHWCTYHEAPMPTVAFLPGSGALRGDLLRAPPIVLIAHDVWTLAFAVLGSILGARLASHAATNESSSATSVPSDCHKSGWWRNLAFVGRLGLILLIAAALLGWWVDVDLGAGTVFVLTWALLGLAALGAILGRGWRRHAWIGAD
jgi:hypothetical protein